MIIKKKVDIPAIIVDESGTVEVVDGDGKKARMTLKDFDICRKSGKSPFSQFFSGVFSPRPKVLKLEEGNEGDRLDDGN